MSDSLEKAAKYFEELQGQECRDLYEELTGDELEIQRQQEAEESNKG